MEPNVRLREIAEARATAAAGVSFVDGLAAKLPLAADSVDVLWCERVLQHLPDPQAAIEEFARVLRPGGRAILLDSDHASRVISPLHYEVEAKISAAFMGQIPNPRAARLIPEQAMRAGFTVDRWVPSSASRPTRPSPTEPSARPRPTTPYARCRWRPRRDMRSPR